MSEESVKIRIAGELPQVELLTQKLREWSKQWGERKIFQVKTYDREKKEGKINKYHRTFGSRRFVNYITLKLPKKQGIPSKSKLKQVYDKLGGAHDIGSTTKLVSEARAIMEEIFEEIV